jgi:uncharacterized RDD family membrane protein YckC
MARLRVETPFHIALEFETAPFHLRLFAWLIDLGLIIGYVYLAAMVLEDTIGLDLASDFGLWHLFIISPALLYHLLWEVSTGGLSAGKWICGLRVVGLNGQPPTLSQYLLRWLLRFLDFGILWGMVILNSGETMLGILLLLGSLGTFIHYLGSAYSQRLGDRVASTVPVKRKLPYDIRDTLFQELDPQEHHVRYPMVMRLSDRDINIIDRVVKQNRRNPSPDYVAQVAARIREVLNLQTDQADDDFLETLLKDYNVQSRDK